MMRMQGAPQRFFVGFLCGFSVVVLSFLVWFPIKMPSICQSSSTCTITQSHLSSLETTSDLDSSVSSEKSRYERLEVEVGQHREPVSDSSSGYLSQSKSSNTIGQIDDLGHSDHQPNEPIQKPIVVVEEDGLVTEDEINFSNETNGKFLIYTCESSGGLCGGWGDRQKGIVNAFLLAVVTKRRFGIRLTSPCDLTRVYVPNIYNWIVRDEELRGKNRNRKKIISLNRNSPYLKELYTIDFNQKYPQDVIYITTNNEFYLAITSNPVYKDLLPYWAQQPLFEFFHDAWHLLMKPTAVLQNRLDVLLHQVDFFSRPQPLVGFHVRIGKSDDLPDSQRRNNITRLGPVWEFVGAYVQNGSKVFLATDNIQIRQMSRDKFGSSHYDTEGVILHIDHQKKRADVCDGFLDAVVEQLMLTRCDVIVKARSGFSRRATMMRGSIQNTFMFKNEEIYPVTYENLN